VGKISIFVTAAAAYVFNKAVQTLQSDGVKFNMLLVTNSTMNMRRAAEGLSVRCPKLLFNMQTS
jgi:hypothetical protein